MRSRASLLLLLVVAPLCFYAGYRFARPAVGTDTSARRILYYVDPMNPSFRSSEPGIAPCGMPLEPVYAGSVEADGSPATAPGAVPVRADRQQLIGVTTEVARARTLRHQLRLLGRVAVDESRLYRVSSVTRGWVRDAGPATTGTLARKGDVLAVYYTPDLATPQQTFLSTVATYEKVKETGSNSFDNLQGGTQLATYERNVRTLRQALLNLGMSAEQVDEIARTRQVAPLVEIRAPVTGFVLARNLSPGQRFEEGTELYTIADLSRVWILADAFEGDAHHFKPGMRATVTQPGLGKALAARVSPVLPQFDPATRTLRVRLEADNPGFVLRPDMFVDVEMPVERGPALTVPKEAVLDSGTRRVVYVAKGDGVFEPRKVETGFREGDRVEIISGLTEGERGVTSGNFLLDSESRMRTAGAEETPEGEAHAHGEAAHATMDPGATATAVDPICGMSVDRAEARAAGRVSTHQGRDFYFCAPGCKEAFDKDPAAHAKPRS
jgi:RND family efflux transporter MFP subunit